MNVLSSGAQMVWEAVEELVVDVLLEEVVVVTGALEVVVVVVEATTVTP